MKTWIITANRCEAKIFEYLNKNSSEVQFHSKLENPRGRLKDQDINADRAGSFASAVSFGSGRVSQQSPTERVADEFAKKIAQHLESARVHHLFDELVLIADPHFLGRIRNFSSKELAKMVSREIPKDLVTITTHEIKERLWPQADDKLYSSNRL